MLLSRKFLLPALLSMLALATGFAVSAGEPYYGPRCDGCRLHHAPPPTPPYGQFRPYEAGWSSFGPGPNDFAVQSEPHRWRSSFTPNAAPPGFASPIVRPNSQIPSGPAQQFGMPFARPQPADMGPTLIPKGMEGIAKLPIDEQRVALTQRMCPVSNQLLGSMGLPLKASVGGRTIFVCCKSCFDELRSDPRQDGPGAGRPAPMTGR